MAARICDEFGIEPELIKGTGGIFDIIVDEQLIFSKHLYRRFPKEEEVIRLIKETTATKD